jgi:protein phosphatase
VIVLDFEEDGGDPTIASGAGSKSASTDDGRRATSTQGVSSSATGAAGAPEDGQSATRAIPVVREEGAPEQRPRRLRIRWRRVAIWVGVLVVLIVGALIGARAYIGHQWYVGDSNGRVAIYNGIPTSVIGFELSHVEQITNLDARQAERLQPWSDLKDGITAKSLPDARTIVEQIRRDLQPEGTG